jgi:hypothetical protein
MPEENLGSGLYLDQSLDLGVGSTGDLRTVSGGEELQKDLAFQLIIILSDLKGQPLTPDTRAEIKSLTLDTILSDSRVDDVDRGSMVIEKPDQNSISIEAFVEALGTGQDLVFLV